MKKAFTLIELAVAVGLLAMVLAFAGTIFNVSIETHRTAGANAEIMQKLRAVTDQLNSDFAGLQKDGYLKLQSEYRSRREYDNPLLALRNFRTDRLYYFATGDFQSWFNPDIKSNIARVYLGHDNGALDANSLVPVSKWRLAHDVRLLTPGKFGIDYSDISYAECKAYPLPVTEDANRLLTESVPIYPPNLQSLMAQNVGQIAIEWTDGTRYLDPNSGSSLVWFGISLSRKAGAGAIPANTDYDNIEDITNLPVAYQADWGPGIAEQYWPKALKFTFSIYDSKGILEKGRTFTHIVYLD